MFPGAVFPKILFFREKKNGKRGAILQRADPLISAQLLTQKNADHEKSIVDVVAPHDPAGLL